jgi:hypothetical protein
MNKTSGNSTISNIKHNVRDLGIVVAVTIPILTVLSLPAIVNETYVRNTTKSLKQYHIFVDETYTKNGIESMKVSGDTTGTLQEIFPLGFEEGKYYDIQIRTYGFKFIETYRIEKPKIKE